MQALPPVEARDRSALPEAQPLGGKRVLVLGLGSFGGGVGATQYLAAQGADVTVTDKRSERDLTSSLDKLRGLAVRYRLGGHEGIDVTRFDMVVVNPAVPLWAPLVREAEAAGVWCTSETNLFFARCKGKTVGVTGSNGKSTTTALTAHLCEGSERRVWLGGNIGVSLLPQVDEIGENDAVIMELSSFQLDMLHRIRISPRVGVLLNLTPNHLDRHGNIDAYLAAKMAIFAYQEPNDIAIFNEDDMRVMQLRMQVPSRLALYSLRRRQRPGSFVEHGAFQIDLGKGPVSVGGVDKLPLPGRFNRSNALAAILAAAVMRTPTREISPRLATFVGVPHRLQPVAQRDGVSFFDDSVSTTPESTIASLSAFDRKDIWLIVGGADKGHDYRAFARATGNTRVVGVLGVGAIGGEIVEAIERGRPRKAPTVQTVVVRTIDEALEELRRLTMPGQVVLLSPTTASYDQYRNFEERGDHFTRLARTWRRMQVGARRHKLSTDDLRVTSQESAFTATPYLAAPQLGTPPPAGLSEAPTTEPAKLAGAGTAGQAGALASASADMLTPDEAAILLGSHLGSAIDRTGERSPVIPLDPVWHAAEASDERVDTEMSPGPPALDATRTAGADAFIYGIAAPANAGQGERPRRREATGTFDASDLEIDGLDNDAIREATSSRRRSNSERMLRSDVDELEPVSDDELVQSLPEESNDDGVSFAAFAAESFQELPSPDSWAGDPLGAPDETQPLLVPPVRLRDEPNVVAAPAQGGWDDQQDTVDAEPVDEAVAEPVDSVTSQQASLLPFSGPSGPFGLPIVDEDEDDTPS